MRESGEVVVVGAGVIGCSVAYHLCTLGLRDVLILERESAAGQGSTAKANGGIRAQWSTPVHIQFSNYSIEAYERFKDETRGDCGLTQAGYLLLTATEKGLAMTLLKEDRFPELKSSPKNVLGNTYIIRTESGKDFHVRFMSES